MIHRIFANKATFHEIRLQAGFNIVLADRTVTSTSKDSRNGLGKSTLVDIIHYCLGSALDKKSSLSEPALADWEFGIEMDFNRAVILIQRSIENHKKVYVEGFPSDFVLQPKRDPKSGRLCFSIPTWRAILGHVMFGLTLNTAGGPYQPSFRSLINYFVRRGENAYTNPFEYFRKQPAWLSQIDHTCLLGLAWEDARRFQILKDKRKLLLSLNKASNIGILRQYVGSRGELEAERVRLQSKLDQTSSGLMVFNVHPDYRELEKEVNQLTVDLHELENEMILIRERRDFYRASLIEESESSSSDVIKLYQELRIVFPDQVKQRLEDVEKFHKTIIENRKHFLEHEIAQLQRSYLDLETSLKDKSDRRAKLMKVLSSHGPWEEYSRLIAFQQELISNLEQVKEQLARLTEVEEHKSKVKIENELLLEASRLDFRERSEQRDLALSIFNQNSEFLHSSSGNLIIEISETGFKFAVEIERSRSQGVSHMKVFCYDVMLAELWGYKNQSPGFLIHDSPMFDGVDERQGANALVLAEQKSQKIGFQYLCILNSDSSLLRQLPEGFDLSKYVRVKLTDDTPGGSLLGIRF